MTVGIDDRTYVIPSMVGGKQLEEEEAIQLAQSQGLQNYPSFSTHEKAAQWIEENHGSQSPEANNPRAGRYSREKGGEMPEEEELTEEQRQLRLRALLDEAERREAQDEANVAAARQSLQRQHQQLMLDRLSAAAQRESAPERVLQEDIRRLAPSPEAEMQRRRADRNARQAAQLRREAESQGRLEFEAAARTDREHQEEVQSLRRGAGMAIAAQANRAQEAEAEARRLREAQERERTVGERMQALFSRMRGM